MRSGSLAEKPRPDLSLFSRRRDRTVPLALRLLSREGCHLCEILHERVAPLIREAGGTLTLVDVDSDPALKARWGDEIPILMDAEGAVVARAHDPEAKIRTRLLS